MVDDSESGQPDLEVKVIPMERHRRRLAEAAGLDPGRKSQAEVDLPAEYWREVLWVIEWRTKTRGSIWRTDDLDWCGGEIVECKTRAIARRLLQIFRKQYPDRHFRSRASRWVDSHGRTFPKPS